MMCSTVLDPCCVHVGSHAMSVIRERATTSSTAHNFDNRCAWCRGTIGGRPERA